MVAHVKGRPQRTPGRVRIIGGQWRNWRLDVPDLPGLRPTPERVRETLFNWLSPVIAGARCLDLCAGTGALGIEALSRGAGNVQFVERDARAALMLHNHLVRLQAQGGQVAVVDAEVFLSGTAQRYDLVFLDPPFALQLWTALAQRLEQGGWLASDAWIYVESPAAVTPVLPARWAVHRQGKAGEVRYTLYRRLTEGPAHVPL